MKNDFTNIFKAINPSEQEEFKHYIAHFYPQQKAIMNTFAQAANAVAENVEKSFLADIKNNKKTLNDLSDLKQWLLEFLTVKEVRSNGYDAKFLTTEALKKRGLQGAFSDKSKLLSQELSKHESPDIWLNLLKFRLNHAAYFNTENEKLEDHQKHLHQLLTELDNFYISTKLRYSAELESRKNILKEEYNPRLLSEILALIGTDSGLNPVIKDLYLPLLKLIKDKSETAYFELKTFLSKEKSHDPHEKLAVLLYALNFTAQCIAKGKNDYNREYLDLAQIGLNQSIFIAAGFFPSTTFNNIINVACFLKKYEWAKEFISKWSVHLNPDDKFVVSNLAEARILFEENKFDASMVFLRQIIGHKSLHYAIQIRVLIARVYYEQKQLTSIQNSHCDTLELYIRRNVKNEGLKESTLNFVKIMRFLTNKKPKKQLLKILEKQEPTTLRGWLKEKVDELKT
jgi:hypothetical protein